MLALTASLVSRAKSRDLGAPPKNEVSRLRSRHEGLPGEFRFSAIRCNGARPPSRVVLSLSKDLVSQPPRFEVTPILKCHPDEGRISFVRRRTYRPLGFEDTVEGTLSGHLPGSDDVMLSLRAQNDNKVGGARGKHAGSRGQARRDPSTSLRTTRESGRHGRDRAAREAPCPRTLPPNPSSSCTP